MGQDGKEGVVTARVLGRIAGPLALGLLLLAGPARAELMIFRGADNGAGPAGPRTNAAAARADWEEAVGTFHLVDFESATSGGFIQCPSRRSGSCLVPAWPVSSPGGGGTPLAASAVRGTRGQE
jgi:hypothetical protein